MSTMPLCLNSCSLDYVTPGNNVQRWNGPVDKSFCFGALSHLVMPTESLEEAELSGGQALDRSNLPVQWLKSLFSAVCFLTTAHHVLYIKRHFINHCQNCLTENTQRCISTILNPSLSSNCHHGAVQQRRHCSCIELRLSYM